MMAVVRKLGARVAVPAAATVLLLGIWAHASGGGPVTPALTWSGTLRDASGNALSGPHLLRFVFHRAGATCTPPDISVTPATVTGAFGASVSLATCPSFFDGSDVTYDALVDGTPILNGQAVSAVPYALYASQAAFAAPSDSSNIARRTRGSAHLYVRTDGSDAACNGTADVAAASGVVDCAVATLQRAVDLLPETGTDASTISVAAGTFHVAADEEVGALITRPFPVSIMGAGAGVTQLSGATAASPSAPAGRFAIQYASAAGGVVSGLTLTDWRGPPLYVLDTRAATLRDLTVINSQGHGIMCEGSSCTLGGAISVTGSGTGGVAFLRSTGGVEAGGLLNISGGVFGLVLQQHSFFTDLSPTTLTGQSVYGILCQSWSYCAMSSPVVVDNAGSWSIIASQGGFLSFNAGVTVSNALYGLAAVANSHAELIAPASGPTTYTFTGKTGAQYFMAATAQSSVLLAGAATGTFNIVATGFANGTYAEMGSSVDSVPVANAGTVTLPPIVMASGSIYRRSAAFPAATTCTNSLCL